MKHLAILLALAGCTASAGDRAVDQYRIVRDGGGSPTEMCEASGRIVKAYLAEGRTKDYRYWRMFEQNDCFLAEVER